MVRQRVPLVTARLVFAIAESRSCRAPRLMLSHGPGHGLCRAHNADHRQQPGWRLCDGTIVSLQKRVRLRWTYLPAFGLRLLCIVAPDARWNHHVSAGAANVQVFVPTLDPGLVGDPCAFGVEEVEVIGELTAGSHTQRLRPDVAVLLKPSHHGRARRVAVDVQHPEAGALAASDGPVTTREPLKPLRQLRNIACRFMLPSFDLREFASRPTREQPEAAPRQSDKLPPSFACSLIPTRSPSENCRLKGASATENRIVRTASQRSPHEARRNARRGASRRQPSPL